MQVGVSELDCAASGAPPKGAEHNQHVLLAKLGALCQRDEVKDYLHGVLVSRMERVHAEQPHRQR